MPLEFAKSGGYKIGDVLMPRLDALREALEACILSGRPLGADPGVWAAYQKGFSAKGKELVGGEPIGPGHMVALGDVEAFLGEEEIKPPARNLTLILTP